MERPSHTDLRSSHTLSSRLLLSGAAIALPLGILWAFSHGMIGEAIKNFGPMTMVPVTDPAKPTLVPPPDPRLIQPNRLTVDQPLIQLAPEQNAGSVTATVAPPVTRPEQVTTPPSGPDRAAAGIVATHTIPPYPVLAERLGQEGKVTLRLTVLADGKVGKAEIVTSSGSGDLDTAAQDWIVAHWAYKPALDKGQPMASQVLTTVVFSLRDQR